MKKITIIMTLVLFIMLAGMASALPIEITNPIPANGAIDIPIDATLDLHSNITSANGSDMMGFMWTNISGVYNQGNWVGPFGNTTINWVIDASSYSTLYIWGVYANDSWGNSLNQSWNFTTEDEPIIPPAPQDAGTISKIVIGLLMVFIGLALIYYIIVHYMQKKKSTFKDMLDMLTIIIIVVITMAILASIITLF